MADGTCLSYLCPSLPDLSPNGFPTTTPLIGVAPRSPSARLVPMPPRRRSPFIPGLSRTVPFQAQALVPRFSLTRSSPAAWADSPRRFPYAAIRHRALPTPSPQIRRHLQYTHRDPRDYTTTWHDSSLSSRGRSLPVLSANGFPAAPRPLGAAPQSAFDRLVPPSL